MNLWKCLKKLEKSRKNEHFYGMEMGWKKWFINISDDEKWLIFMIENSLKIMRNGWWKIIYKYDWDLKMTYENKWEWKANYKYKWDNFLDYDMKNHDIHENKNPCPEFNGEKMHEHQKCKKPWFYKGFRHSKRIFDTVLIPKITINNGKNVKILAVVCICPWHARKNPL